ncbi:aspartate kinase [Cupriavidus basilensis]|uniref:Aspartate kinase n=1 Tax=Cupriavidus basilensis TaxID=68895 RepID=A0ABT6B003_9BURK|nr:aspartate kinase [Cupriavidus basilensis]MDF3838215.1 aspartate kinase [Cupriavidus basilensis]
MHVVKIGGSLGRDPLLRDWLRELAAFGGGRVVVVPGGGGFADAVRESQAQWGFDDLVAHNMAVLAMVQYGLMLQGLCPGLKVAASDDAIRAVLRDGGVAVWTPFGLLRKEPDALASWDATSDSIAAWLANRLGARRLVLVKSCPVEPGMTLAQYADAGVVDRHFCHYTRAAAYPVALLQKDEPQRLRELLGALAQDGG